MFAPLALSGALSAVRGMGFGVLTVCGSSAVAQLVEPERRGAGIGAYGLAVAVPNVFALSLAPWLVQQAGVVVGDVARACQIGRKGGGDVGDLHDDPTRGWTSA